MESGLPDGDLVRLARSGDAVAFRLLVERYQLMVLARALRLAGTPGAIKARLHKARSRLAGYVAAHRPDLMPYLSQGAAMVTVRLARTVPHPDEQHIHRLAVLLVDDAGRRALALWTMGMQIDVVQALLQRQGEGSGGPVPGQGLAGRLLHAAGAQVTAVDIDELGPELTVARIGLDGPAGPAHVTVHLAEGLALALEHGAPIRVADAVMANLAQPLHGEEPLARLLRRTRPAAAAVPGPRRQRRPRNLTFTEGLEGWELRGSFLRDATAAHWHDYSCQATEHSSAILAAGVPAPYGFADLRQAILAGDYHGSTVRFRGQIRIGRAPEQAGLYLRVVTGQSARDGIDQRTLAPAEPGPRRRGLGTV